MVGWPSMRLLGSHEKMSVISRSYTTMSAPHWLVERSSHRPSKSTC